MGEEKEILRFELDASGAMTEAAKLEESLRRLKDASTGGGGAGPAAVGDAVALDAAAKSTEGVGSATEQLIAKKRQLSQVVNLVGGSFGAEVSQVGSLVSLLMTATPVIGQVAIGLAALSVGIKVFTGIKKAAEEAAKAQRDYNEALREAKGGQLTTEAGLAKGLEAFGARSPENIASSWKLMRETMVGFGKPQDQAAEAAGIAVGAGFGTPEDAAVLGQMKIEGVPLGNMADTQRFMKIARENGDYERLLAKARPQPGDTTAAANIAAGMILPVVAPVRSPVELAYEALKPQLPKGMEFATFKTAFDDIDTERSHLAQAKEERAALAAGTSAQAGPRAEELDQRISAIQDRLAKGGVAEKWVETTERVTEGRQAVNQEAVPAQAGITIHSETYIATQHNTGDRRSKLRRRESSLTNQSPMP